MIRLYGYETAPQERTFNTYEDVHCFHSAGAHDWMKFLKYGYGKVTDQATGTPLGNVCVTVGIPGAICWGKTDVNGNFKIDMVNPWQASPGQFELYFILQPYAVDHSPKQLISSVVRIDFKMHP